MESNEPEPAHAVSILLAGQSQLETGFRGGFIPGFMDGLANKPSGFGETFLSAPVTIDPYFIDGTRGGTAICKTSVGASATNYWWDSDTDSPGPVLLNHCIAAIDAAMAAGQPAPETVLWAQGESDVPGLAPGGATSEARYRSERQKVMDYIRAHLIAQGAADPQFVCIMLGSYEDTANGQGWQAVRRSYLQQFAEVPWVHYGAEMYDMPRPWMNLHMYATGRYTLGVRMARAYANVRAGQSNNLGPQITAATVQDGAVRLSFSAGVRIPRTPASFAIRSPTGTSIPVTRIEASGSNVILHTGQDVTGAQVVYPADHFGDAARGDSIIYSSTLHVKMPGLPLRSTVINIT